MILPLINLVYDLYLFTECPTMSTEAIMREDNKGCFKKTDKSSKHNYLHS